MNGSHGKMMMGIAIKKAVSPMPRLHLRESNNEDLLNPGINYSPNKFDDENSRHGSNLSKRGNLIVKGIEKKMTAKKAYIRSRDGTRVHFQEDQMKNVQVKNFVFHEKYGAV